ncbi:MAG: HAMP domain-containing histidine kinase, partial [Ekhidna sp.]|nr:HAMP domain-containing histidine kinase [Ekhidna sp.]
ESTLQSISINSDSILRLSINPDSVNIIQNFESLDSLQAKEFEFLTQKVVVSVNQDLLDLGKLYTLIDSALTKKRIDIEFLLRQKVNGRQTSIGSLSTQNYLQAEATSALLGSRHSIAIDFENATSLILKNGISELVFSVLLIGLVLGTMGYLYKTIQDQKQLAAIKDDLISNITHEFKTPIATIFSALEGVTNFNENNDQEKTRRYLALSNDQLKKLNNMVEKMLETATIDQGKLTLNKEELEVVEWTRSLVGRFEMVLKDKTIHFETSMQSHIAKVDRFHVENALSNLIDNAIKYGGEEISIRLSGREGKLIWEVEDNGGNIPKEHRDQIFDKLYRIPTGNQHDVKGFGIGLYYARTIAGLHGGTLTLESTKNKTNFKLSI